MSRERLRAGLLVLVMGASACSAAATPAPLGPLVPRSGGPLGPLVPRSGGPLGPLVPRSGGPLGPLVPRSGGPLGPLAVTLDIRYSRFSESHVEVPRGTRVRFVMSNDDPIAHELIVGDQAVQDRHEFGTETQHGEPDGEVSVAAGASAETSYTFAAPGPLLFGCHLPGHWAYGMRGTIVVT